MRLKIEGEGEVIEHSELAFGPDGLVMVATANHGQKDQGKFYASPQCNDNKNTGGIAIFVDDVDAHCIRARAAGAKIFREIKTSNHGSEYWSDRTYGALDLEGHIWWFMQRCERAARS